MPRPGWRKQPEGERLTDHLPVGVIEYQVTEGEDTELFYRLFCTITDPEIAPAHELVALYSKRWVGDTSRYTDEHHIHSGERRGQHHHQHPRSHVCGPLGDLCDRQMGRWLFSS